MRQIINRAMMCPDDQAIAFDYTDSKGATSRRVASPIRFLSSDRFLALCLCREEPRQFYLQRCLNMELVPASEILMPVPLRAHSARI